MNVDVYRGLEPLADIKGARVYDYIVDSGIDVSDKKDKMGKPFLFVETKEINGEIEKWDPFFAQTPMYYVTFRCPVCNCTSAKRHPDSNFNDPRFEGNFYCKNCDFGEFTPFSDAFIKRPIGLL